MRFHEAVAQGLLDQGVHTVFGLLGDGNLFMMESFSRLPGTAYVSVSHEATAVQAAIGFAHTSGELGVATVTHGPALTNTVTPLVEAVKARMPLLLVAGDTAVRAGEILQSVPQREIVLAAGAGFEQLRSPETIAQDIATAIRRAHGELRPIVLNVPVDFQWVEVDYTPARTRFAYSNKSHPDLSSMNEAVGIIASSRRPVILAGKGAISPESREALVRLASRIGAPVATTLKARDLFRGHTHNLGIFGTLTHEVAFDAIARADCIIAFGASLNSWTTAEGSLLAEKRVVHVDAYHGSIGRHVTPDAAVIGDAAVVADAIGDWLDEAEVKATGFASSDLAESLASQKLDSYVDQSTDDTIDLRTALLQIDTRFPSNRTLVTDAGRYLRTTFKLLHVEDPTGFIHTTNFGAVGLSMGVAIGAFMGAPTRPVLLVCGDGGLMLGGLTEFITAVRHGVDLVVVVFNDSAFGAEYVQLQRREVDPAISTFVWPDFAPIATAMGGQGLTVRTLAELDTALSAIADRDRPVLIDVKIDRAASVEH